MVSFRVEIADNLIDSWRIFHEKGVSKAVLLVGCINGGIFATFYTLAYIRIQQFSDTTDIWIQMLNDPTSSRFYFAIAAVVPGVILDIKLIDFLYREEPRPDFFQNFHMGVGVYAAVVLLIIEMALGSAASHFVFSWTASISYLGSVESWLLGLILFILMSVVILLVLLVPILTCATQGRISYAIGSRWLRSSLSSLAIICLLSISTYYTLVVVNSYMFSYLSTIAIDSMPDHPEWGTILNWFGVNTVPSILAPYLSIPVAANFRVWSKGNTPIFRGLNQ